MKNDPEKMGVISEWDDYTNKIYNYLNSLKEAYEQNKIFDNLKRIYSVTKKRQKNS